jgi:lauroyl/myristoyl acyltransferase
VNFSSTLFSRSKLRKASTETDPLARIMQFALGESPREAEILARQWQHYRKVVRGFWEESARVSLKESIRRADNINMNDSSLLVRFINGQKLGKEGLVLLTIHMGDYLHAILKILMMASHRQVIVLRRKAWNEEEYKAFDKLNQIGHELLVVRQNEGAAKPIIRGLRKGAIVVMLYDLPYQWGATTPVSLFNQKLNWVMGPIQLAMLGRSCVLPFFTFEQENHWYSELHPVRDYRCVREHAVLGEEVQSLAQLAEGTIKRHVTQWNHWHLLPDMLAHPELVQETTIAQVTHHG